MILCIESMIGVLRNKESKIVAGEKYGLEEIMAKFFFKYQPTDLIILTNPKQTHTHTTMTKALYNLMPKTRDRNKILKVARRKQKYSI